jgi:hypothetical protein
VPGGHFCLGGSSCLVWFLGSLVVAVSLPALLPLLGSSLLPPSLSRLGLPSLLGVARPVLTLWFLPRQRSLLPAFPSFGLRPSLLLTWLLALSALLVLLGRWWLSLSVLVLRGWFRPPTLLVASVAWVLALGPLLRLLLVLVGVSTSLAFSLPLFLPLGVAGCAPLGCPAAGAWFRLPSLLLSSCPFSLSSSRFSCPVSFWLPGFLLTQSASIDPPR